MALTHFPCVVLSHGKHVDGASRVPHDMPALTLMGESRSSRYMLAAAHVSRFLHGKHVDGASRVPHGMLALTLMGESRSSRYCRMISYRKREVYLWSRALKAHSQLLPE